uniref:Serine-rich adhesin for platelets-like n=1 Tax=Hirondellea gigas TaxID=1518452 RepID=A0A2P2HYQ4_9CRUS
MALVAYSDESDVSGDEDEFECSAQLNLKSDSNELACNTEKNVNKQKNNSNIVSGLQLDVENNTGPTSSSTESFSNLIINSKLSLPSRDIQVSETSITGIDSIIDDDVFVIPDSRNILSNKSTLLSSLPDVSRTKFGIVSSALVETDLDGENDELTDVPTTGTWKVTQDIIKNKGAHSSNSKNASKINNTQKSSRSSGSNMSKKPARSLDSKLGIGKAQQLALASSALGSILLSNKGSFKGSLLMLPAMSEFTDEDDDEQTEIEEPIIKKKVEPSAAGTGLLSMLPQPKNSTKGKEPNRTLMPHILTKPPPSKKHLHKTVVKAVRTGAGPSSNGIDSVKHKTSNLNVLGDYEDSDDDDNYDASDADFFSLDKEDELPLAASTESACHEGSSIINEVPDASDRLTASTSREVPGNTDRHSQSDVESNSLSSNDSSRCKISDNNISYNDRLMGISQYNVNKGNNYDEPMEEDSEEFIATESVETMNEVQMDNDAWRRLTGKKRCAEEDFDIIDVNASDALLTRDEWMNHAASQEKPTHSHSKKKGNLPSHQQKQKHQITYLAHQAKEREVELKNEWSAGRAKKQQTRAKYGF